MAKLAKLDDIVSLCKRRGFIFQSSEIYGGLASCYDYGPLGVELKRNVRDAWWKSVVKMRDDIVGLDCSILMHPLVWKASGHADKFEDVIVMSPPRPRQPKSVLWQIKNVLIAAPLANSPSQWHLSLCLRRRWVQMLTIL